MDEEISKRFEGIDKRLTAITDAIKALGQSFDKTNFYIQDLQKAYNHVLERVLGAEQRLALNEEGFAILARHDEGHHKVEKHLKAMIDAQSVLVDALRRDSIRLHDAYYHVFPERLKQDVRLEQQLDALVLKPSPDAEKK